MITLRVLAQRGVKWLKQQREPGAVSSDTEVLPLHLRAHGIDLAQVESEFFDRENFAGPAHFLAAITTDQHCFNFARKNRSRGDRTPAELLRARAPALDPRALLWPPVILAAQVRQDMSGLPRLSARAGNTAPDHVPPGQGRMALVPRGLLPRERPFLKRFPVAIVSA